MADYQHDERTPLLVVVRTAPPRQRYQHSTLRKFCSTVLALALLITLTIFLLFMFIVPDCEDRHRHGHRKGPDVCIPKHPFFRNDDIPIHIQEETFGYPELVDTLLATPEESKAREWSYYYTSGTSLAGKNISQAEWTKDKWVEFGIPQTEVVAYDIYVNYPLGHRLALLEKSKKTKTSEDDSAAASSWKVKYEATLKEDVLEDDPTTSSPDSVPTFHGYSASGNVTAQYVYVNYGTYGDFEDLVNANVSLKGKIALARYGRIFRGLKVKRAQDLGMIGAILYSDPGDDGDVSPENGDKPYPEGPARNPSSVQRGSAQFLSISPGDPTTPGYPSLPGVPRQPANFSTPSIPSLPISYVDALPLLKALNGYGPKAKDFNKWWQGGGLGDKGVKYNIGPSPPELVLNLVNEQEYVTTPMWNVIGIVNGTIEDEVVILGNHRDAWIVGGAGDPHSGSAAMNEVVRSFGAALAKGWKPLRTIVLASWDGEEYGLIGSTEWVEEYLPWLNETAVAYLNVDVGTTGPYFKTSSAPLLNRALIETTKLVLSPNQTVENQTVYDTWNKHISTMGSGSDFTAFQDYAGIPSLDMGFSGGKDSAIYHYHSNYDSFHWMDTYGDPGWHYHVAIAKLWSLLAAKIVETPILQLNATDYAIGLRVYLESIKDKALNRTSEAIAENEEAARYSDVNVQGLPYNISFHTLDFVVARFHNISLTFDAEASALLADLEKNPLPWWKWWSKVKQAQHIKSVNDKYKFLERQFLYEKGLDGRPWFKHVVFAPGKWTGYSGATFPGLVEAIEAGDLGGVYRWMGQITRITAHATKTLEAK